MSVFVFLGYCFVQSLEMAKGKHSGRHPLREPQGLAREATWNLQRFREGTGCPARMSSNLLIDSYSFVTGFLSHFESGVTHVHKFPMACGYPCSAPKICCGRDHEDLSKKSQTLGPTYKTWPTENAVLSLSAGAVCCSRRLTPGG